MKRKTILILLPFLIHIVTTIITSGDFKYNTLIFILFIYFFSFLLKSKNEILYTILGYFSLTLIVNIIEGNDIIKFFFMIFIFFIPALFSGYYSKGKKYKSLLFPFIFTFFMLYGYNDYRAYYNGRKSTFIKKTPNISLYTSNLKKTTLNQKDKVYVLDFWSTSCGVCIQKFPDFEKKVFEYKDNPNVVFYSINIPVRKENINDNIQLVKDKYNFKFNKLYAKDFSVCDSLGFNKFPTLIILKNDTIYYQGSLIFDDDITIHHIDNEIKRVLNIK